MKGILSIRLDDDGLNSVKEQLKESNRFVVEPIHLSTGLKTIYVGMGPITNEFWLHDAQMVFNRELIYALDELDYLPDELEIRLTNTARRLLVKDLNKAKAK